MWGFFNEAKDMWDSAMQYVKDQCVRMFFAESVIGMETEQGKWTFEDIQGFSKTIIEHIKTKEELNLMIVLREDVCMYPFNDEIKTEKCITATLTLNPHKHNANQLIHAAKIFKEEMKGLTGNVIIPTRAHNALGLLIDLTNAPL